MESDQARVMILHDNDGECSENCDLWDWQIDGCQCALSTEELLSDGGFKVHPTRCPGPGTYALMRVEESTA